MHQISVIIHYDFFTFILRLVKKQLAESALFGFKSSCSRNSHVCASALVVFLSICALGIMLTLLGGAEATRVNWEQGLSDVSGYYCDYMLKDMCQAHELGPLQATGLTYHGLIFR